MIINETNAATFAKYVTFDQYLEVTNQLDAAHKAIAWPVGTGSGQMGLTPDHIKATTEFRQARAKSESIKRIERAFNQVCSKRFKKEIRAYIDARRAAKMAGK